MAESWTTLLSTPVPANASNILTITRNKLRGPISCFRMRATLGRNSIAGLSRGKLSPVPSNWPRQIAPLSNPAISPSIYHPFRTPQHTLSGKSSSTWPLPSIQHSIHEVSTRPHLDTIYALSTAQGRAAIAVIRISGRACLQVRPK